MSSKSANTQEIYDKCDECGLCTQECVVMSGSKKTPREIAHSFLQKNPETRDMPYMCSLCGLCREVCPLDLSPRDMFLEGRRRLVDEGLAPSRGYMLYMSDRKWNVYTLYRESYGINYSDLIKSKCDTVFFPGCSMATFAPELTRAVFKRVVESFPSTGLVLDCCHRPLYDMGLQNRFEEAITNLGRRISDLGASRIVVTCPLCYYKLAGQKVLSIYDLLEESELVRITGQKLAIHDSCPDRESCLVGSKVRGLLKECQVIEMEHSKERSICCGAGGLVSVVDPQLTLSLINKRLSEAKAVDAGTLIVYCVSCANMLRSVPTDIRISHILNILFDVDEDYVHIQQNLQKLLTGPTGMKNFMKMRSSSV
jgi:fumarate reductase (CoM/CoB) subunit B